MPRRRRKPKPVPVLTALEARAKLKLTDFRHEVYELVFDFLEERFGGKIVKNSDFAKRFYKGFQKTFDETYYGDLIKIVMLYRQKFRDHPKDHVHSSFFDFVRHYIYDKLEIFWCEGNFTDGQGCIY